MGTFCSDLHYLNNSRFLFKERFGKAKIGIGGIDIKFNLWCERFSFCTTHLKYARHSITNNCESSGRKLGR